MHCLSFVSKKVTLWVFLVSLLLPTLGLGWDAVGHEVVAEIAYSELTPNVKLQVDRLVKVLRPYYPSTSQSFALAATWPDQIKSETKAYNTWHYIDLPIGKPVSDGELEDNNVVWAIEQSEIVLANKSANRLQRAVFLRFLAHFVADIHQPLHCASLFNSQFLAGDRGGNDFLIQVEEADNLHAFWDMGLGLFKQAQTGKPLTRAERLALVQEIKQRFPRQRVSQLLLQHTQAKQWAEESHRYAQSAAYADLTEHAVPSQAYIARGQQVVRQQLALAGYRLADHLQQLLG